MPDITVSASPTQDAGLTLAQQARVNLLILSIASRYARFDRLITQKASRVAEAGLTQSELVSLNHVASARFDSDLPPFGRLPPARPFSYCKQRAYSVESVESAESAEAFLARGNQLFEVGLYDLAFDSYRAALEIAEGA